jgi:hypothetical protein
VSPLDMTWSCNELGFFGCFSALTLSHISSMVSLSSPDVLSCGKVFTGTVGGRRRPTGFSGAVGKKRTSGEETP